MAGDLWTLLNDLKASHPNIFVLLSQPGVAQVAIQVMTAEDQGHPWTNEQINAAMEATPYFQTTPDPVRAWINLQAVDPATAGYRAETTKRLVDAAEQETGLRLNDTDSFAFFVNAVKYGWDANEIKYRLLASVNTRGGTGGTLGQQSAVIKGMANDYGVPLSDPAVMNYARSMLEGNLDQAGMQGYLKEQAESLFPALKPALDRGITVRQYADPYLQLAQQELGVNPSDVNFTDGKWMQLLNQIDPKTGARVSMTLDQALKTFRTDPAIGYDTTDKAKQDAASLTNALASKFGAQ